MGTETHSIYQLGELRFAPQGHRLSLGGEHWLLGLSVSPEGSHLVYGLLDSGRADLMLVENFE